MRNSINLWYGLIKQTLISKGYYMPNKDFRNITAIIIRAIRNNAKSNEIVKYIRDYIGVSKSQKYSDVKFIIDTIRYDMSMF